jgi:hypothetical protein
MRCTGDHVFVKYRIDSIQSWASDRIIVHANSIILAEIRDPDKGWAWTNVSYIDEDPVRAALRPPDTWTTVGPLLPPPNPNERLTQGARLSDSIFKGLWWAAGETGYLDRWFPQQILDANISFHLLWGDMQV